jgi:hypothetical protein
VKHINQRVRAAAEIQLPVHALLEAFAARAPAAVCRHPPTPTFFLANH